MEDKLRSAIYGLPPRNVEEEGYVVLASRETRTPFVVLDCRDAATALSLGDWLSDGTLLADVTVRDGADGPDAHLLVLQRFVSIPEPPSAYEHSCPICGDRHWHQEAVSMLRARKVAELRFSGVDAALVADTAERINDGIVFAATNALPDGVPCARRVSMWIAPERY